MIRLIAALLLCASTATAQTDPAVAAQAAADRLEAANVQLAAAGSSRDRISALTETVHAYEDGIAAMRDGLRRAAIRERVIKSQLDAKSEDVRRLLGVLQSIGRNPSPLLLLHPNGALGTARSGMMTADMTPALQTEVEALRAQIAEVAILQTLQESASDTLIKGLRGAQDARTALSEAVSNRTDLPTRFQEDKLQMSILLASTETLDAFASGLTQIVPQAETVIIVDDKGALPLPVQGQLLRSFNAVDAAGIARPGVLIAARPRALVTTPIPATLLFHGPLLDYGNVVILEPAANTMFVISGLAEVYGTVGDVLPANSPIGLLGGQQPTVDAILTESDQGNTGTSNQTLYLEVREGQTPVNPATWFALE